MNEQVFLQLHPTVQIVIILCVTFGAFVLACMLYRLFRDGP